MARESREWQELGAVDLGAELGAEIYGADPGPHQRQLGTARHAGVAPRRRIQRRRDVLAWRRKLQRRPQGLFLQKITEKTIYEILS